MISKVSSATLVPSPDSIARVTRVARENGIDASPERIHRVAVKIEEYRAATEAQASKVRGTFSGVAAKLNLEG